MMRNLGEPKRGKPHGAEMANGDDQRQGPRIRAGDRGEIRGGGSGSGDSRAMQSERARGLFLVSDQLSAITTVQTLNVEGAVTFE
jgi:hypothetical protein